MTRVLLLLPTTSYRAEDFLAAAARVGAEPLLARDRCQKIAAMWPDGTLAIEFHRPEEAAGAIVEAARAAPLAAIVPTDELGAVVAAIAGARLGLPHNPPEAARATSDKHAMRERLAAAGVPQPAFRLVDVDADPARAAADAAYPCVLKPRHLSASRGVIRADGPDEFVAAFARLRRILAGPAVAKKGGALARSLLCESYVDGVEVAVEAIVTAGRLEVLAIFDKPDPLVGPFFEETIYVVPSRLPRTAQRAIADATARAAFALGIVHGPVHAELRVGAGGPAVIEVAARTIGGLCARTLRFGAGASLEEIVLRHAVGEDVTRLQRDRRPSGVMMLPIPREGVLRGFAGVDEARAVPLVEGVEITARVGDRLAPPPEGGHEYLGFVFARGDAPAAVEAALRAAHARLRFDIAPALCRHDGRNCSRPTAEGAATDLPVHFGAVPEGHEQRLSLCDSVDQPPVADAQLEEPLELIAPQRVMRESVDRHPAHLVELLADLALDASVEILELREELAQVSDRHVPRFFLPK